MKYKNEEPWSIAPDRSQYPALNKQMSLRSGFSEQCELTERKAPSQEELLAFLVQSLPLLNECQNGLSFEILGNKLGN